MTTTIRKEFAGRLEERFVSLQVDVVVESTGELLGSFGGEWDRRDRCHSGDAPRRKVYKMHDGQVESMRWFCEWLRAYAAWRAEVEEKGIRDAVELRLRVKEMVDAVVRFVLLIGGRRGGKTYELILWAVMYGVAISDSIIWCIAPSESRWDELERELEAGIPSAFVEQRLKSEDSWRLWNGSVIKMISGWDGKALKRGRADFIALNEAQDTSHDGYLIARGALADKGGLCVLAANPPKFAAGAWVDELAELIAAKMAPGVAFTLTARDNPHVDWGALTALKSEMSEDDYAREVLGESRPRSDMVWSSYRPANIQNPGVIVLGPDGKPAAMGSGTREVFVPDITTEFLLRHFRQDFKSLVVADFQLKPYMAASVRRIFSPYWETADPNEALDWTIAEAAVERGDENDLINELEAMGLEGESTLVIADASGEWQNAERTKGGGSFDMFKRRQWHHIICPDELSTKNPAILDSFRASNARLHAADGYRRSFVAPSCLHTIRALKNYENRAGMPNRRSEFAHFSDTFRYMHWRFWPRRFDAEPTAAPMISVDIHGHRDREFGRSW